MGWFTYDVSQGVGMGQREFLSFLYFWSKSVVIFLLKEGGCVCVCVGGGGGGSNYLFLG